MPDAAYMISKGINRIVVWTKSDIQADLKPIINNYRNAGIEIIPYMGRRIERLESEKPIDNSDQMSLILTETKEAVRKFENARFGLLLAVMMAAINLFGMFFVNAEPLFWTTPSIMWLTYLWVSEIAGDLIAIALSGVYFALYLLSQKRRHLITFALALFSIDVVVFFIYVLYYGIAAFTGYSLGYGLVAFGLPIISISLIGKGVAACKKIEDISEAAYFELLDHIDGNFDNGQESHIGAHVRPRRRLFRAYRSANYRGYRGYGGTGRGGYRGSGGFFRSGGFGG
jgi:hypothetical protein